MKTTVDCITPRTGYTACQRLKIIAPLIVLVIGCYYDGIASSLSGSDSREVEANSLPAHAEVGSPVQVDFPVRGSVTDAAGNTVFGVSIIEKGTSNGTTSAGDGSFTLNVTDARAVLVFSRVGFASLELVVTANMFVKLTAADSNMDEVVVVGYGTQRRRNVSSAISTLKIENTPLVNLPNPNFLDLLKGRITGLNIGAVANAGGNPS